MSRRVILTDADYITSLRGRGLRVFALGERIEEPVDHPLFRPSIEAMAETYRLATEDPGLAMVDSPLIGAPVNRFLHIAGSAADVVAQNRVQRCLGQRTGTCFQRCVGMDAINALWSVTWDTDRAHGTDYHARLRAWVSARQHENVVLGGAMTDPKGDRGFGPRGQADPDLFVRVVARRPDGVVLRGAKLHQTGAVNSHWLIVMPGQRLAEDEGDYAVVAAVPVTAPGLTFVLGRQSCDTRALEGGPVDQGNARYGGQEAMIILEDVFVPEAHVFLDGEAGFAAPLVERFTNFHRRSYVCKTGVGDVLIGAAAAIAEAHGVERASHVRDKLVEMIHLNETIYGAGIAASHESTPTDAGNWEPDPMLANVCKHNVTRFPFELARLAQDLAGGLMVTLPGDADFAQEELGPLLRKYLVGRPGVSADARRRLLRLIENLTLGRNAVGYLTESLHGAGSPQAQRIVMQRAGDLESKKRLARRLAGLDEEDR